MVFYPAVAPQTAMRRQIAGEDCTRWQRTQRATRKNLSIGMSRRSHDTIAQRATGKKHGAKTVP
jgi:hypothetical protein